MRENWSRHARAPNGVLHEKATQLCDEPGFSRQATLRPLRYIEGQDQALASIYTQASKQAKQAAVQRKRTQRLFWPV